jgi:hypothetical protein
LQACAAHPVVERRSLAAAGHRTQPFLRLGLAEAEVAAVVVFHNRRCAAAVAGSFLEDREVGLD